jgi:branched-chain amino acid transport system ATP-binding protein
MTVLENLQIGGYTRKEKKLIECDIDLVFGLFPHLKSRAKQKAGTLSTGEQQMLAIGRALMLKPKLLLADEPSLGLSPNYVELIFAKLAEINREGTNILLVEQNAIGALEIAHRAYVFGIGRITHDGNAKELLQDKSVLRGILGGQE